MASDPLTAVPEAAAAQEKAANGAGLAPLSNTSADKDGKAAAGAGVATPALADTPIVKVNYFGLFRYVRGRRS
jgi:hypothetical protein